MKGNSTLALVPEAEIPEAGPLPEDLFKAYVAAMRMECVCAANNGIGLSAVQVGLPWDMFIIHRPSKKSYPADFEYYALCKYAGSGDKMKSIEGCLSLTAEDGSVRRFEVERYGEVVVSGKRLLMSEDGQYAYLEDFESTEGGYYAVVFQHEIDHSKGVLISHIGKEVQVSDA